MLIATVLLVSLLILVYAFSKRFRGLVHEYLIAIVGLIFVVAVIAVAALVATDYLSIDACLDRGGRWDEERAECQYQKTPTKKGYSADG